MRFIDNDPALHERRIGGVPVFPVESNDTLGRRLRRSTPEKRVHELLPDQPTSAKVNPQGGGEKIALGWELDAVRESVADFTVSTLAVRETARPALTGA